MPRFKVLSGCHAEETVKGDPSTLKMYHQGEIFDSNSNLLNLNGPNSIKFEKIEERPAQVSQGSTPQPNPVPLPPPTLHQPISTPPPASTPPHAPPSTFVHAPSPPSTHIPPQGSPYPAKVIGMDTLESMSVKELQAWAAEEEIDIKGSHKKEEILRLIRATIAK